MFKTAKFQIRQRRYHQCSKPPNFRFANAADNLTYPLTLAVMIVGAHGILAVTALAVLKFGVFGCRPFSRRSCVLCEGVS